MKTNKLKFSGSIADHDLMLEKAVDEMNDILEYFKHNAMSGEIGSLKFSITDTSIGKKIEINLNEELLIDTYDYGSVSSLKIAMKNELCDIINALCPYEDFDFEDFE